MATLGLTPDQQEALKAFEADVIQPSMEALVILQFTAKWCGPCQQLSPVLDQIAADFADKGVVLKRVDIDKQKFIAEQFRIQSVPTVYALFQGQPVADLTQYRTPGSLKTALDQIIGQLPLKGEAQDLAQQMEPHLAMGEEILEGGDHQRAKILFEQLREMDPDNPRILGGLAQAMIGLGEGVEAQKLIDGLTDEQKKHPAVAKASAQLDIAAEGEPAVDTSAYIARLEAEPDDHEARFELAKAAMAAGERDAAADHLLYIVEADRDWNEGAAREKFLSMLEANGLTDDWSKAQRRRLSAILFG